MATIEEKQAASESKGALIEKVVFAAIPILFSCIVYLFTALSNSSNEILTLKAKIAVVVNTENKAIPPQGTTIDMATIREKLGDRIDSLQQNVLLNEAGIRLEVEKIRGELDKRISIIEKSK